MTPAEFEHKLDFFRQGALQRRNLYLWLAGTPRLRQALTRCEHEVIEVPALLADSQGEALEVRRSLERALRDQLTVSTGRPRAVALTEPGLLARYLRDLSAFNRFVCGSLLVVIAPERLDVSRFGSFPPGLAVEPMRVAGFFRALIPAEDVVEEVESEC